MRNSNIKNLKALILLLNIIFLSTNIFAQEDSLREEILNYENPQFELINKGRLMTIDKLLEFDKKKVTQLLNYLVSTEEKSDYVVFYPAEKWLLFYWTEQYENVIEGVLKYDYAYVEMIYSKIRPPEDLLLVKLIYILKEQNINIKNQIRISGLSQEEKDFLLLNLDYLLMDYDSNSAQDGINVTANNFLNDYPSSKFNNYIRSYVRNEYIPSNWGLAFEFFSGYGIFTGDLNKNFTNNVPMGIAFDISYKRINLFLRNYIGFSKTTDSIPFKSGVWSNNSQVRVYLPEASLGFVTFDSRRFKIIPFAGISSTSVSPTQNDITKFPYYDDLGLDFTTTYTMGINFDYKLGKSKTRMVSLNEQAYWFLRIRYAYNQPQFNSRYHRFDGDFHYITVGIGGFGRSIKRNY